MTKKYSTKIHICMCVYVWVCDYLWEERKENNRRIDRNMSIAADQRNRTHRYDHRVCSVKFGDVFVSAVPFGSVQRPEPTHHLYPALGRVHLRRQNYGSRRTET